MLSSQRGIFRSQIQEQAPHLIDEMITTAIDMIAETDREGTELIQVAVIEGAVGEGEDTGTDISSVLRRIMVRIYDGVLLQNF
jgi:hypothetical protein